MSNMMFSIFPSENFVDLGLFQFGRETCDPAHSYGPAARNHFLFHYVLSGAGTLLADDSEGNTQTYHIKSNQGFMIFPGQINTYIADKDIPWEYVWIEFDGLRVKWMLEMKSPQDFLLAFRMAKAAELLKITDLSIGEIGQAVGYDNSLHFSRAFKNIYGIPPREWRNENKIVNAKNKKY